MSYCLVYYEAENHVKVDLNIHICLIQNNAVEKNTPKIL